MTRRHALNVAIAVVLVVVAASASVALNIGFLGAANDADSAVEVNSPTSIAPTTTTYEQYLEEYYAQFDEDSTADPTTTVALPSTTLAPVVVYEYIDVPVTTAPPQIVYVPVEVPAPSASGPTAPPGTAVPPAPSTTLVDAPGPSSPTDEAPTAPTTAPPAPTPSTTVTPAVELVEFGFYDIATITVASHGPGSSLQVWEVEKNNPWVFEIEADGGQEVELKFFNPATGGEAKFELALRGDGFRLKQEGDGYEEVERNL